MKIAIDKRQKIEKYLVVTGDSDYNSLKEHYAELIVFPYCLCLVDHDRKIWKVSEVFDKRS